VGCGQFVHLLGADWRSSLGEQGSSSALHAKLCRNGPVLLVSDQKVQNGQVHRGTDEWLPGPGGNEEEGALADSKEFAFEVVGITGLSVIIARIPEHLKTSGLHI
jgi:hypothetical protein